MWRVFQCYGLINKELPADQARGNRQKADDNDLVLRKDINAGLQCPASEKNNQIGRQRADAYECQRSR